MKRIIFMALAILFFAGPVSANQVSINLECVTNPICLERLLDAMQGELNGPYVLTRPALANGSGATPTVAACSAFDYVIAGKLYHKAAATSIALTPTTAVPQSKYGAFCFDINSTGTILVQKAPANGTGYTPAASAVADLPAPAVGECRMGYMTVISSSGAYTPGTTALNGTTTAAYTDNNALFSGKVKAGK